jgi:hypothetical protein
MMLNWIEKLHCVETVTKLAMLSSNVLIFAHVFFVGKKTMFQKDVGID